MTATQLLSKINTLPSEKRKEVEDFIDFLIQKLEREETKKPLTKRQFGYAKGFFKMSDDFDEPLEDFKDYM
jgi:hypothetical protein